MYSWQYNITYFLLRLHSATHQLSLNTFHCNNATHQWESPAICPHTNTHLVQYVVILLPHHWIIFRTLHKLMCNTHCTVAPCSPCSQGTHHQQWLCVCVRVCVSIVHTNHYLWESPSSTTSFGWVCFVKIVNHVGACFTHSMGSSMQCYHSDCITLCHRMWSVATNSAFHFLPTNSLQLAVCGLLNITRQLLHSVLGIHITSHSLHM